MKIVINIKDSEFTLSYKAVMRYAELKGIVLYPYVLDNRDFKRYYGDGKDCKPYGVTYLLNDSDVFELRSENIFNARKIERNDPCLVQAVEELGEEADTIYSKLKIVEIPDDVKYEIMYEGREFIREVSRIWS